MASNLAWISPLQGEPPLANLKLRTVEGLDVLCHAEILASASPSLAQIISEIQPCQEMEKRILAFEGPYSCAKVILHWIYHARLANFDNFPFSDLPCLLHVCTLWQLTSLQALVQSRFKANASSISKYARHAHEGKLNLKELWNNSIHGDVLVLISDYRHGDQDEASCSKLNGNPTTVTATSTSTEMSPSNVVSIRASRAILASQSL
jgi:hypothetical protein